MSISFTELRATGTAATFTGRASSRLLRACVFINPERGALPPVGVATPFSHNKKGRRMAPRKQKHPAKVEQRRRLTIFFNKEARKSAADALKKASWLLAAANAYLGFAKGSVAYMAIVAVGWLVAQTLAVILLSLEEEQVPKETEEQEHASTSGITGKRTQP